MLSGAVYVLREIVFPGAVVYLVYCLYMGSPDDVASRARGRGAFVCCPE